MKNSIIMRFLAFFAALLILTGCTKENLLVPQQDKSFKAPEPEYPVYDYGIIKGLLTPVPYSAAIKVYNNNGFSRDYKAEPGGEFKIINLPADTYNLQIAYVIQKAEYTYTGYFDIWRVSVKEGELTNLGIIELPWSY